MIRLITQLRDETPSLQHVQTELQSQDIKTFHFHSFRSVMEPETILGTLGVRALIHTQGAL